MFHYLLFDSSQHMRFHLRLDHWGVPYQSLFQGHAEESFPELAPLLIDVTHRNNDSQRLLEEIIRIGQKKPCLSRLTAIAPLVALAEHLRQFHLVHMPDGRTMLMRWYDTRILPVWIETLHPDQRAFFTRIIVQWSSFDRFGAEQHHAIPMPDDATPQAMATPLQIDAAQAQALLAAGEPDALIFELRETIGKELEHIPAQALYPFVVDHLRLATEHGLSEKSDQLQFLLLALHTSGRFVDLPSVVARLASPTSAHSESFAHWCDALPDSTWASGKPLWEQPGEGTRVA